MILSVFFLLKKEKGGKKKERKIEKGKSQFKQLSLYFVSSPSVVFIIGWYCFNLRLEFREAKMKIYEMANHCARTSAGIHLNVKASRIYCQNVIGFTESLAPLFLGHICCKHYTTFHLAQ